MSIYFLVFAMFFSSCLKEGMMTKPAQRNVLVSNAFGTGSGVIIGQDLVLSCFHMVVTGSDIFVNGQPAQIVKVDPKNDLVLLRVETKYVSLIKLAESGSVGDELIIYSNPLNHVGMVLHGRIVDIAHGYIYTDAHVFFGSSGGGAYNAADELVGIVHGMQGVNGVGTPYGILIPAGTIFRFLAS